jgi:hypothetical protein
MALSFGVAFASLVAALFLKDVAQADHMRYISGLHHTFLVLGGFTIVSSLTFARLHLRDGVNVSQFVLRKEAVE